MEIIIIKIIEDIHAYNNNIFCMSVDCATVAKHKSSTEEEKEAAFLENWKLKTKNNYLASGYYLYSFILFIYLFLILEEISLGRAVNSKEEKRVLGEKWHWFETNKSNRPSSVIHGERSACYIFKLLLLLLLINITFYLLTNHSPQD